MKNRWKINEKSAKILQNRAWVLFGVPQRFGNVLGASWELPGSVLEPPGRVPVASRIPKGLPTWTPFGAQNPSKIDQKSRWFFYRIVCAILIQKWSQNGPSKPPFYRSKKWWIFRSIFYRFFHDLYEPKSLKMSTSPTREAHFHKIAYPDACMILKAKMMKKGSQNRAKMASKIKEKIRALFHRFLGVFWEAFGSTLGIKIP